MKSYKLVSLFAAVMLSVSACSSKSITGVTPSATPTQTFELESAQNICNPDKLSTTVADNGNTLQISTFNVDLLSCIFNELAMPTSVVYHVDQTRAIDGRQEDAWSKYKASWTYHPDDGLNMVITKS